VILRAEYLHYSFAGASSIAPIDAPFVGSAAQFNFGRLNVDEARVGVSYLFDFLAPPGPVAAK
jgi:hypothetical protein